MSDQNIDYEFDLLPSYAPGRLSLRRVNYVMPVPPPTPVHPSPPNGVHQWLQQRGWVNYGDTVHHEAYGEYTWEQAVAIEFVKFANIGMDR